jgi:hypothetical protein
VSDALRAISVADKLCALARDGLGGIDLAIAAWPAEYRAIVWMSVADIASRRASEARDTVSTPSGRDDSTDHIDWDTMAEERLGQRSREHGRHIPQTSPAPGCDSGSPSAALDVVSSLPGHDETMRGLDALTIRHAVGGSKE